MPLKSSDELLERNANGLYDHETTVTQLSRGQGVGVKGGAATLLVVLFENCWYNDCRGWLMLHLNVTGQLLRVAHNV